MSQEVVSKRNPLVIALLVLVLALSGLGALLLVQNLPEIRREVKIWMM